MPGGVFPSRAGGLSPWRVGSPGAPRDKAASLPSCKSLPNRAATDPPFHMKTTHHMPVACYTPRVAVLASPERTSGSVLASGSSPDRPGVASTSAPGPESFMDAAVVARFWAKVDKDGPVHATLGTKCWVWSSARNEAGYGLFSTRGKLEKASRWSWSERNGPILNGLFVLHKCDNPPCVNPDHLFLGTHADNMRDMVSKGRCVPRRSITYDPVRCPNGHLRTTYGTKCSKGRFKCTECARLYRRAWAQRKSAALSSDGGA